MSIKREQFRERIANPNSLVNFRGGLQAPDIGRAALNISGQIYNAQERKDREAQYDAKAEERRKEAEARRLQAYEDMRSGQRAGNMVEVIDEEGQWRYLPRPEGSVEYLRAYDDAVSLTYEMQFEKMMGEGLSSIQMAEGKDPVERAQMMRQHLEGAMAELPTEYHGRFRAWGEKQLRARTDSMLLKRQNENEQLLVAEHKEAIQFATEKALGAVRAGNLVEGEESMLQIEQSYQAMVDARYMTEEFANTRLEGLRSQISAAGIASIGMDSLLNQSVMPSDIERLGEAIMSGGGEGMTVKGADGKELFSLERIRGKVTTQKEREALGRELKQMANAYSAWETEHQKKRGFVEFIQNPKRYQGKMPSEYNGMKDDLLRTIMDDPDGTGDWMTDAGRVGQIMRVALATKENIKPVTDALFNALTTSSETGDMVRAIDLYSRIATLKDDNGDAVGKAILADMPEEQRDVFDAVRDAYEGGMKMDNIRAALERMGEVSMKDVFEAYKAEAGKEYDRNNNLAVNMGRQVRTMWVDEFGFQPPAELGNKVMSQFYFNYLLNGDIEKSMEQAYTQVKSRYNKSNIFAYGTSTGPLSDFENPYGYEPPSTPGIQAEDVVPMMQPEYPWLEDYVKSELFELEGQSEDIDQLIASIYQDGPAQLGKKVFLHPTDTPGEYEIMIDTDRTDEIDSSRWLEDPNGRRIRINPRAKSAEISLRNQQAEEIKAMKDAVEETLDRDQMLRRAKQSWFWPDNDMPATIKFLDDLPDGMRRQSALDKEMLYARVDKLRLKHSYQRGEPVKLSANDAKAFIAPRANGKPIVDGVVSAIDSLFPDGTGGRFLRNIAKVESNYGLAAGSFRDTGDKGIWQLNTGKTAAWAELNRVMNIPGHPIAQMADRIEQHFKIPIRQMKTSDLDMPLVNGLMARMYMQHKFGSKLKPGLTVDDEAYLWKKHYNTYLGAGSIDGYRRKASG